MFWTRDIDCWTNGIDCWTGGIDVVLGQYSKRRGGWSGQRSTPVRPHLLDRLPVESAPAVPQEMDVALHAQAPSAALITGRLEDASGLKSPEPSPW